jgi:TonB-linked SusC/RagA family outer membrane protein
MDETNLPVDKILQKALENSKFGFKILANNLIVIASNDLLQQSKVIGTVSDEKGNHLPGVTVLVKGTTSGALTDASGKYVLNNLPQNATLIFSFIGMDTQEISTDGRMLIDVVLKEAAVGLQEVVVVGYGTQKKVTLTGSISNVSEKELKEATTMNLADDMAGKVAGFRVMARTSEPGEYSSNFDIRGWGSPLVIIDGIQSDDFVRIDPNEIESVTVLKDASAAIYGVKAANGVILVTTKKGLKGSQEITYSGTYGWQTPTVYPNPMNAAQFCQMTDWAQQSEGSSPTYSQQQIEDYKSGKTPGINWMDVSMNKSAPQQQHNLTISGGNEKVKYFGSIGIYDQGGLYKSGDLNYTRYNLRLNLTAQIAKNLEAEIQIGGISDKKDSPSEWVGNILMGGWSALPTNQLYANNNPKYLNDINNWSSPFTLTNSSFIGYNDVTNNSFQGSIALNYKIPFIEGLKARILYGQNLDYSFDKNFNKSYAGYTYYPETDTYVATTYYNSPSRISESFAQGDKSTLQTSLNYEKTINGKHNIKGLILYENLKIGSNNFNAYREYTVDAVDQLYAGNSVQQASSNPNNIYELANQGIVGRLNYDYLSKYLLEFSFREDGSSKFPKGKRWGFFPAFSLGWRMSEENFIKNNLPFITNLKLRGSWGQMGDDAASTFQFIPGYYYPSTSYIGNYPEGSVFNDKPVTALSVIGMVNPNITWYKATTMNFGVDANMFKDKLNFIFDIFRRDRTGLLATRTLSLPQSVGASLPQENLNGDRSSGVEFTLGTTQHINNIFFGISAQFSYTQTQWLHSEQAPAGNSYLNWRNNLNGRNQNIIWGYKIDGQFQTQNQINSAPNEDGGVGNTLIKPGDNKYTDINGDGVIDDWDVVPIAKGNATTNVYSYSGQSLPEITYGLNLTFGWKGFDVKGLFQGATNFSIMLNYLMLTPLPWGGWNGLSQFYDCWHQADVNDPNSKWIPGAYPTPRLNAFDPNSGPSSPYTVKDASYLRLKSLEIGYTLPEILTKKLRIQKLRVFTNGYNIVTWTKLKHWDPEYPQTDFGLNYPISKNFNIGVNVTF